MKTIQGRLVAYYQMLGYTGVPLRSREYIRMASPKGVYILIGKKGLIRVGETARTSKTMPLHCRIGVYKRMIAWENRTRQKEFNYGD